MASFDVPTFVSLPSHYVRKVVDTYVAYSGKSRLSALCAVRAECGFNPHINKWIRWERASLEAKRRDRRLRKAAHLERQYEWAHGGQQAAWLAKNGPYGSTDAIWFRKRLARLTGMQCWDQEIDPIWCTGEHDTLIDNELFYVTPSMVRPTPLPRCVICGFRSCTDEFCALKYNACVEPRVSPQAAPLRDWGLLRKLRKLITALRERRGAFIHHYRVKKFSAHAVHQMDRDEHGQGDLTITKTSNVIMSEQSAASVTAEIPSTSAFSSVVGDNVNRFESCVNRPYVYKVVEWKTSDAFNTEILTANLPRDFLIVAEGSVNIMPFTVHRYFRGDMVIRVQLNANKFMAGQLQIAWWYQGTQDANFSHRNNIGVASQTMHTLLNAGTSNEAILRIPYRYYKSALEIGQRRDKEKSMDMGILKIRVLNPLSVTSSSKNSCYFTVFIHFENAEFSGNIVAKNNKLIKFPIYDPIKHNSTEHFSATHQMETAAALVAAGAVSKFFDANRDKPTVNAHPTYFSPQTAQSWCVGTAENEAANSLRLEHAQVPHPNDYVDDDFTVKSIATRYGYLTTKQWLSSDIQGQKLFSFPLLPMCDPSHYMLTNIDQIACRILPPVSYLSNLFQYWRGSLKFRFDFVATSMHTGRLILGYIPGDYLDDATMADLYSSPYVIYDLKEAQQLEMVVPYIADKKFWPRYLDPSARTSDVMAPGFMYCFVVAPLALMDSIPNNIQFNIYIAGGDDFELAIPAQPSIGLAFNPFHNVPKSVYAYARDSYYPYYVGTYTHMNINDNKAWGSEGKFYGVYRYGVGYEHVAQFWLPKKPSSEVFYYLLPVKGKSDNFLVRGTFNRPADTRIVCFLPWYDGEYVYLLPCRSATVAIDWGKKMLLNGYDPGKFLNASNPPSTYFYEYPSGDDGDNYFGQNNPPFEVVEVHLDKIQPSAPPAPSPLMQAFFPQTATHQMDNRFEAEAPTMSLVQHSMTKSMARMHFGESFDDLKNLCRRYQPYATATVSKSQINSFIPGDILFAVPIMPQGLDILTTNPFSNCAREGHIPLLLAGYRYFRGSIRLRITLPTIPATYFIQHKPFEPYINNVVIMKDGKGRTLDTLINHTYAYTVQATSINPIITIEVPYYAPYDSILLQKPIKRSTSRLDSIGKEELTDVYYAFTLGEIHVGLLSSVQSYTDVIYHMAYSLGDDARPSVFQGFPPVIITQEIPILTNSNNEATHQMKLNHQIFNDTKRTLQSTLEELQKLDLNNTNLRVQETLTAMSQSASKFDSAIDSLRNFSDRGCESMSAFVTKLKDEGAPEIIVTAISQIAHVINNPTPSTMAISLISFLSIIGILSIESIKTWTDTFVNFFSRSQPQQQDGTSASAKHQIDENDSLAIATMLFTGISTAMNVKTTMSSKFSKGLAADLMSGLSTGCKDGGFFFRFFQNILGSIVKVFNYLRSKFCKVDLGLESIVDDREIVITWVQEAIFLTDPQQEPLFEVVNTMVERVNMCYTVGSLILAKLIDAPKTCNISAFRDVYNKICTLKTKLADKGKASCLRREPFVVCVLGAPGIGKSQMAHRVILTMLQYAKIPYDAAPIYTHPAGAKYWENVNQEPAMFMDDVLILRTGETVDTELAALMSLKSCALFSPPIAECDRKKKRYSPEILYMHTNTAFPEVTNMQCPEALYRRRDMLIETKIRDGTKIDDYTVEQLDNCDHLLFRRHKNPKNKNTPNPWSEWINYKDYVLNVCLEFDYFRKKQIESHAKKINYMTAALEEIAVYPELNKLPLAEILKNYSTFGCFSNLNLYRTGVSHQMEKDSQPSTSKNSFKSELERKKAELDAYHDRIEAMGEYKRFKGVDKDFHTILAKQGTALCDDCLESFMEDIKTEEILAGKLILGRKPTETATELKELYRHVLLKKGCKHLFWYKRTFISTVSTCCFETDKIRHFCHNFDESSERQRCSIECMGNMTTPLLDDFSDCSSHCIRYNKSLLSLARQLYHLHNAGSVIGKLDKDPNTPEVMHEKPVREFLISTLNSFKNMFISIKNFLVSSVKKFFGCFSPVYDFLKKYWKWIGIGLLGMTAVGGTVWVSQVGTSAAIASVKAAGAATVATVGGLACRFRSKTNTNTVELDTEDIVEPDPGIHEHLRHQIIASGDIRTSARAARVALKANQIANAASLGVTANHQMDHEDAVVQRILDNTIHLIAFKEHEGSHGLTKKIRALALGDRFVITVLHAWELFNFDGATHIRTFVKDRPLEIPIDSVRSSLIENSSLVILKMPSSFPQFRRITQFFARETDHIYRAPTRGTLFCCGIVNKAFDCDIQVHAPSVHISGIAGASDVSVEGLYTYNTQAPGMCGSLLLGALLNAPIIGMHIAGNEKTNKGYAAPLYFETFAPLFNQRITDIREPIFFPIESTKIDLQTTIFPMGGVGKAHAHHSPIVSNIHQSAIHGYVPPTTAPAPLSDKDPRLPPYSSPLVKGCEKHGILTKDFPYKLIDIVKNRLKTHLFSKCKPMRGGKLILTDSQAIVGDSQLPFCDPLNWNSSEGFPYFNYRPAGARDKKWCFKLEDTPTGYRFKGFNDLIGPIINFKRAERNEGVPQPTIFTDCLKDARIPLEKVPIPGKTRIFSMSPVDYTIDFRKYFYDFISTFQVKRLDNYNAIGINKFSDEWDYIARMLNMHGNVCTGDYSNFGPGLNEEVAKVCMDIICEWYDEFDETQTVEEQRTRACLAYELIGSYHLCHDLVYTVVAGIPSGSPITVVLNSLVNIFYIFLAWEILAPTFPIEYRNFDNFNKNCTLYTYGDDFIMSVSSQLVEYFNTRTIAGCLAKFDIKMTDAFKGAEITPYASLEKSTFLKGSFTKFKGRYWYGLEKSQILDMVNFVNSKHNKLELTFQNAQAALLEAHGHGPDFFNNVKMKLTTAFKKIDQPFHGRTFQECTDLKVNVADDPELRALAKKILPLF